MTAPELSPAEAAKVAEFENAPDFTTLDVICDEIEAWDNNRPRSLQVEIGASGLYGCRAASVLRLNGVPETDGSLRWDALVGTAIHGVAEAAAPKTVLVEQRFTFEGVTATIDRYDPGTATLTDAKTKEDAAAVAKVRKYGPDERHVAQVMLGAAALQDAGYDVERVEILYLPRVGNPREDGYLWSATPDREQAVAAAEWAREVTEEAAARAEMPVEEQVYGLRDELPSFCFAYCPFVTACRGTSAPPVEVDPLIEATVREYLEADAQEKDAAARKAAARRFLEPYQSLPGLRWQGGNAKSVEELDLDRMLEDYRALIGEPPTRTVEKVTARSLRRAG
jgi:hypothetical protein